MRYPAEAISISFEQVKYSVFSPVKPEPWIAEIVTAAMPSFVLSENESV